MLGNVCTSCGRSLGDDDGFVHEDAPDALLCRKCVKGEIVATLRRLHEAGLIDITFDEDEEHFTFRPTAKTDEVRRLLGGFRGGYQGLS